MAENGRKTEKNQVVKYHKYPQYKSQLCHRMTVQVSLDGLTFLLLYVFVLVVSALSQMHLYDSKKEAMLPIV